MNHQNHRVKDPIIPQHPAHKNRRPSMVDDCTQTQKEQCHSSSSHHHNQRVQQQTQHPHANHPAFDDTFGHVHWGNPGTERIAAPQGLEFVSVVHHNHHNNNNDNTNRCPDRY